MYHAHFGMHTDPFPLSPKLVFVYQSKAFGETMAHLIFGIEQDEDIILITGGIGTGKTLAVHNLLNQVSGNLRPVLVNVTRMTFHELVKYVLLELDQRVVGQPDVPDLLQMLKSVLGEMRRDGRKVLLVIDEAQQLDAGTLEGLRLLLNLSSPDEQMLQLILVGQPALEATISKPQLAQLNQRIRVRYRLEPLSRREVEEYIDHRVRVAGCHLRLFKPGAFDRIYELSQGIPRVVNILASRGLLAAFVDGKKQVDAKHVRPEDLPPVSDETPAMPPLIATSTAPGPAPAAPPDHTTTTRTGGPVIAEITPPATAPYPGPVAPVRRDRVRGGRGRLALAILIPVVVVLAGLGVWQGPRLAERFAGQGFSRDGQRTATTPVDHGDTHRAGAVGNALAADAESRSELPRPAAASEAPAGRLMVHVASYRDASRARALEARLQSQGFATTSRSQQVGQQTWTAVYVGPFGDRATAQAAEARLQQAAGIAYARLLSYAP